MFLHIFIKKIEIYLQSVDGNKSLVQYQANGQLLASNGTFIYCPDNQDKTLIRAVIINRVGRIRMAEDLNNDGVVESKEGQSISCA